MRSAWTCPPDPACFAHTGWDTCPALLTLKVLLNATRKVKSQRIKVNSHKEVSHLNNVWSVILQSKLTILRGILVVYLESVPAKTWFKGNPKNSFSVLLNVICIQFVILL